MASRIEATEARCYPRGKVTPVAYDEQLAARIRDVLGPRADLREQKMFGGLAFMIAEHMAVGIVGNDLMLRLGDRADEVLREPYTRPMDFTGRPMKGFVFVEPAGVASDGDLGRYVARAVEFAESLPPKSRR
jgi:hypothetical protein